MGHTLFFQRLAGDIDDRRAKLDSVGVQGRLMSRDQDNPARVAECALIFINWNSGRLAVEAAASALASVRDPASLRIIVVDNGSQDDSLEIVSRELPEAEVIALPENRGFAKAVNAGLRRVTEPYAFILNVDVLFQNDAIALLRDALLGDDHAVLACPELLRPDGSKQAAVVPAPRLAWELTNRSLARRLLRVDQTDVSVVSSVVGPCMAVDMARLERVGFLDGRFFFFFEETDWCKRICDAGLHVLFVPAAKVVHLQGEQANRRPIRARVQFYSSRYRYFRKHAGPAAVGLLYAGLLLRLTVNVLLYLLFVTVTLGAVRRLRDKLAVYASLWGWHLLACRPKWGFEG